MPNKITYTHIKIFFFCVGLLLVLASAVFWYRSSAAPEATPTPSPNTVHIGNPVTDRWTNGLVGYWSFNGQDMDWAKNQATNRSSSYATGTLYNMSTSTSPVPGKVGQALSFDGVDDYIQINDSASFTLTNGYTLSAWIYLQNTNFGDGVAVIGQWGAGGAGNASWAFYISPSKYIGIHNHDGSVTKSLVDNTTPLNTNQWYYITGVYDGGTSGTNGHLYINGKLVKEGTLAALPQDSSYWVGIGRVAAMGSNAYFKGLIDEVRIYNRALSAEEIWDQYRVTAGKFQINNPVTDRWTNGLVGYWSFNGQDMDWASTTAEALDRSGNNNNGNVVNFNKESVVPGKVGQALKFDGVDDYVDAGNSPSLQFDTALTVEAWIKQATTPTNVSSIVTKGIQTWEFFVNSNGKIRLRMQTGASAWDLYGTSILTPGQWFHVVGVYDSVAEKAKVYVNGVKENEATRTGLINYSTANPVRIGIRSPGTTLPFNGLIDEVRIYNRALSAEEIWEHYRVGRGIAR